VRRSRQDVILRQLKDSAKTVWQALFAVLIFFIFGAAVLVGAGAISMPEWSKALDQLPDNERPAYAGALLGSTCLIFLIFLSAGLIQMRREAQMR
jgi:TRAP-type C4-dicarboxylate transport system permease small subunit